MKKQTKFFAKYWNAQQFVGKTICDSKGNDCWSANVTSTNATSKDAITPAATLNKSNKFARNINSTITIMIEIKPKSLVVL